MFNVLFFVSLVFAIARFIVPVEGTINHADIFKDMAHIWVGVLFGVAVAVSVFKVQWPYKNLLSSDELTAWSKAWRSGFWILAIGLTAIEVVAFFARKAD